MTFPTIAYPELLQITAQLFGRNSDATLNAVTLTPAEEDDMAAALSRAAREVWDYFPMWCLPVCMASDLLPTAATSPELQVHIPAASIANATHWSVWSEDPRLRPVGSDVSSFQVTARHSDLGIYLPDTAPGSDVYVFWKTPPPTFSRLTPEVTLPRALRDIVSLLAHASRQVYTAGMPDYGKRGRDQAMEQLEKLALHSEPYPGAYPWLVHQPTP